MYKLMGLLIERLGMTTIASQVFFLGCGMVFMMGILMAGTIAVDTYFSEKNHRIGYMYELAKHNANRIEGWYKQYLNLTSMLAQLHSIRTLNQEAMLHDFSSMITRCPHIHSIVYLDDKGVTVVDTHSLPGFNESARDPFEKALLGQPSVSNITTRHGSLEPVLIFATPTYDLDGRFSGAIGLAVKFDEINSIVQSFSFGNTGEVHLVDRQGKIVSKTRFQDENTSGSVTANPIFSGVGLIAISREDGVFSYENYRGQKVWGTHRYVGYSNDSPFGIIIELEEKEIMTPVYYELRYILGISFVFLVLYLPVLTFIADKISRPIAELAKTVGSNNNLSRLATMQSNNGYPHEVKQLYKSFSQMAATVGRHQEEMASALENQRNSLLYLQEYLGKEVDNRRQAEAALSEYGKYFYRVIESYGDIVTRFDEELRYEYVSPEVKQLTGMSSFSFLGKTPSEVYGTTEWATEIEFNVALALENEKVRTGYFEHKGLGGTRIFFTKIIPERDLDVNVNGKLRRSCKVKVHNYDIFFCEESSSEKEAKTSFSR